MMLPQTSLETRDLRLIRAIVESGGVTRAATALHLSQSAVSHQLKDLEGRIGLELFARRGRSVHLTDAGRRLLDLSREVLEPMARVERELVRERLGPTQNLRLTTQCQTAYCWLPRVLGEFAQSHPGVRLSILADLGLDPVDALREARVDLGFCVLPPKDARFSTTPLFADELVAILPTGHPLARKGYLEGADFEGETLILPDVSQAVRRHVAAQLFPKGGNFRQLLRMPLTEVIVELVKAGQGVSILTSFSVSGPLARKELVALPLTRRGLHRKWHAVQPKRSEHAQAIKTLVTLLQREGAPQAPRVHR